MEIQVYFYILKFVSLILQYFSLKQFFNASAPTSDLGETFLGMLYEICIFQFLIGLLCN